MDVEPGASVLSRCPEQPRHLWTVEEYHRMGEVGILRPTDRIELIDGEIIEMALVGSPHIGAVMTLNQLLIIEVSDTSLRYDREVKLQLYARGKIPEVWIVDLTAQAVTVYRNPEKAAYTVVTSQGPAEALEASALPGLRIPVGEIV